MKADVFIKPIKGQVKVCIRECFEKFGGVDSIIKGNVYIKINGTGASLAAITNPEVIIATVEVIKEQSSNLGKLFVFENSAVTQFTRLVFKLENLAKRIKDAGGKPLYLDEEKSVQVDFKGKVFDKPIPIAKILYEDLIKNKKENTYINLPKLKSHIQTDVTICIKNQLGLVYDAEKVFKHHQMDQKLIDIMNVFKPDFNIVDATTVVDYGPVSYEPKWERSLGLLIAGIDAVAVDTVGANLIGIKNVDHIQMAAERGFGCNNMDEINVIPSKEVIEKYQLQLHSKEYPLELPGQIHFFKGKEKLCRQGCLTLESGLRLTSLVEDVKPCIGIAGKGHDVNLFDEYTGPFIVSGPCAVEELKPYFEARGDKDQIEVIYLNDHMNLAAITKAIEQVCQYSVEDTKLGKDFPFSKIQVVMSYINAKLHGVNCMQTYV